MAGRNDNGRVSEAGPRRVLERVFDKPLAPGACWRRLLQRAEPGAPATGENDEDHAGQA